VPTSRSSASVSTGSLWGAKTQFVGGNRGFTRVTRILAPHTLASAALPARWSALADGAVLPQRAGRVTLTIDLQHGGRYRLWVGGSLRGTLTA